VTDLVVAHLLALEYFSKEGELMVSIAATVTDIRCR
jgi:hypothetical protein